MAHSNTVRSRRRRRSAGLERRDGGEGGEGSLPRTKATANDLPPSQKITTSNSDAQGQPGAGDIEPVEWLVSLYVPPRAHAFAIGAQRSLCGKKGRTRRDRPFAEESIEMRDVDRCPLCASKLVADLMAEAGECGTCGAKFVPVRGRWMCPACESASLPATFTCPKCHAVSHNPNDVANRYCGRCCDFYPPGWEPIAEGGSPPPAPSTDPEAGYKAGLLKEFMETATRKGWGKGPWDGEPDREEFEHAGLPCLLNRGPFGGWCGYAAVPPGHPLHGRDHNDDDVNLGVHGGLTYSGPCERDICHVPKPGEPDNVWWFGFDCSHAYDVTPGLHHLSARGLPAFPGEAYRDINYVRRQTIALAIQLAALAKP